MKVQWLRRANLSKSQQSLTYSACTPAPASHFSTELRNLDVAHAFPPVNHWSLLVPPINISLVPPFPCLLFLLPSYSMVLPSPLALCIPCWPAPLPPGLPSTQLQGNLPTTHIWPFTKVPSGPVGSQQQSELCTGAPVTQSLDLLWHSCFSSLPAEVPCAGQMYCGTTCSSLLSLWK